MPTSLKLTFVLLLFACREVFAQSPSQVLELKQLGDKGILLDKGWVFHPGDNLDWAKPDFDDREWQAIDPMLDLHYLPQIHQTSVGWLRIKFRVDSSLLNKPLALQVDQHIASQIYLNGKLFQQYGTVSANAEQVRAYQPNYEPMGVLFQQPVQVIAVRFSVQENLPYFYFYPYYKVLEIRINEVPRAYVFEKYTTRFHKFNIFEAGLFIILGLVFLGIFLVFDQQKANLYFSLANFAVGIGNLLYIDAVTSSDVAYRTYIAVVSWLLMWVFYNLLLFLAIYSLFAHRKGLPFWVVICLFLLGTSSLFYNYQWTYILGISLPTSIIIIELLRISIPAYRKGRRGVSIVIIGLITYLISVNIFYFIMYGFLPNQGITDNYSLIDIAYHIYIGCIPISLSIYLGREYAFTSKDLEKKLQEVQQLSAQTLAQEQEKRQILAIQNETLEKQVAQRTFELSHQKEELQSTLEHLKATQTQLVQREKMASLGELTAGIAHEIQNPLNFVNNFSEVSTELVEEIKQETVADHKQEVLAIAEDLQQNLAKIHHHGQRADAIVKSMLQHSRARSGQKQLIDINALADEYLRLSYHGLRAKDKDFKANLITELDNTLEKVKVVPQEFGRVLLNLFNNAFYATQQKKAQLNGQFQPEIKVTTRRQNGHIEIKVRDNGIGIPEKIKNKIFQPFFTTKPTGQGTGLGLSLSYDIITKGHGGELKVETEPGTFTEFIIILPHTAEEVTS
ncbi:MAG: ATP-binding protein [Bacteroidota bacterium]|nr:ATP-binding protein [Bacteroidota bacterium]